MPNRPPEDETIGQRIRRLRTSRRLSQRDIQGPGVSYAFISRIERGQRLPSMKALRVLARNLGVSVEYLETGNELRDSEQLELRLSDAELQLRFADDPAGLERVFRDIHAEAVAVGDRAAVARSRAGIGFAALSAGRYAEAALELQRVIREPSVSPASHPDLFIAYAKALVEAGARGDGVQVLTDAVQATRDEEPFNRAAYVKFATYLGCALDDLGDRDRAAAVLAEAAEHVDETNDPYAQIRLLWSNARLQQAEQPALALRSMRQAISLLESTEDTLQLARAHLMCAAILTQAGKLEVAGRQLELADDVLMGRGSAQDQAVLRAEQGKLAARLGRPADAVALASAALELLGDANPVERGRALCALAEGLAGGRNIDGADVAYAEAVDLLAVEHREAQALRDWATLLQENGQTSRAFEIMDRASLVAHQRPAPAGGRTLLP